MKPLQPQNNREIRKKILGKVEIESAPVDLYYGMIMQELNIPPNVWETFSNKEKGKIVAIYSVRKQIEQLERYLSEKDRKVDNQ